MNTWNYQIINSSCCIETSSLICSANQWTGFCIIGTALHPHNSRVRSYMLFSLEYPWFTEQQVNGETISLYPFYNFSPLHRHLNIHRVIAGKTSTLHIAGNRNRTWNLFFTLFGIHSFYSCTFSCCCLDTA